MGQQINQSKHSRATGQIRIGTHLSSRVSQGLSSSLTCLTLQPKMTVKWQVQRHCHGPQRLDARFNNWEEGYEEVITRVGG
jgi:hypothetical protein